MMIMNKVFKLIKKPLKYSNELIHLKIDLLARNYAFYLYFLFKSAIFPIDFWNKFTQ
jgi:hypothetical protein